MSKEGRKIKSLQPMSVVINYIMPDRNGASNRFACEIDITETDKYIHQKRREGMAGLGLMHVILAAYIRTVAAYPGINRFIRGQRTYARNSVDICLTIKKELNLNADETVIKYVESPDATLNDVYYNMEKIIAENRTEGDTNGMDRVARFLVNFIPGVFLKFTIWLLKLLDYFGLLPSALTKVSPFHGSLFITNMGSLGIPPIYHHLYDFGNLPVFVSMGAKRTAYVLNKDGVREKRKFIGLKITCDERICDGHYYAVAFKRLKRLIENASLLDTPPEEVKQDIK